MDDFKGFAKDKLKIEAKVNTRLCQIEVTSSQSEANIIKEYIRNSNVHKYILPEDEIKIWTVKRPDDEKIFRDRNYHLERRMLLWHGTRNQNIQNILNGGFRKPSESQSTTGSMFGKGNYFADRFTKAANYSGMYGALDIFDDDTSGYGVVLLCEVALGDM